MNNRALQAESALHHDVIVVGAGFAGIYAIHKFRDQMGLSVQGFDAAGDVGGTWYWNRYPGARVDIESIHYSYSFDPELEQSWSWTERFAAQPEILRYLNHCADRYDVRRSVKFGTRVVAARWNDDLSLWEIETSDGETHTARWFISGAGTLSVAKTPDFPGISDFRGRVLLTGDWREEVDLAGLRVGIIGVGSSGIQTISEVSKVAGKLVVFQRTPNFATPIANAPTDPAEERADKARYRDLRAASRNHFLGVPYDEVQPSALAVSPEERRAVYENRWERGGFRLFIDSFGDVLTNAEANDTAAEFIRSKIRQRVSNPATADLLCPQDYPYGTKRPPLETDYYEAFNRPDTYLIDVKSNPINRIVPEGVRLKDGTVHDLDVLILATGFDACTGPLLAMNVSGRSGLRLKDVWADGPQTYLGLTVHGFPNMFIITGPQSPSVLYNMPLAIEDHIDFAADAIAWATGRGMSVMDATSQAQDQWVHETTALSEMTLLPRSDSSWYMGANIPGKPRRVLVYLGGAPRYRAICDEVQENGYRGFAFAQSTAGLAEAVASPALDPCLMFVMQAFKSQGFQGFDKAGVEGTRAAIDSFTAMQRPAPEMARSVDRAYGAHPEQVLRIHVPHGDGQRPVLVYLHGGGFVGGGIHVVEEPARDLAARTGAIVVTPTYRRAPEHRFPAAHDDAFAALAWVHAHILELGGDPARIALAGDSAGGSLATATAIRAQSEDMKLAGLLLIYPLVAPAAQTGSRIAFGKGGYFIGVKDIEWFGAQYLNMAQDAIDPRLDLGAARLGNLPPTLILANEFDPLRDEAEALSDQINAAGGQAEAIRFPGLAHGVFWMSGSVFRCEEQRSAAAEFLRKQLRPTA